MENIDIQECKRKARLVTKAFQKSYDSEFEKRLCEKELADFLKSTREISELLRTEQNKYK